MPKGIYKHPPQCGFQKGHKINTGNQNTLGMHYNIGSANSQWGKPKPLDVRLKIRNTLKRKYASGEIIHPNKGKHWKVADTTNCSLANIKKWQNPVFREKMIKERKERWKNPEYREKTIKNILKALFKRPTSFEKIIIDIIKEYSLPYKYVGDGSFLIGYKNPDFIEINGEKICIEVFHNYFKERDCGSIEEYKKQRSSHFAGYGWKTIFVDGNEIKDKNKVLQLISYV